MASGKTGWSGEQGGWRVEARRLPHTQEMDTEQGCCTVRSCGDRRGGQALCSTVPRALVGQGTRPGQPCPWNSPWSMQEEGGKTYAHQATKETISRWSQELCRVQAGAGQIWSALPLALSPPGSRWLGWVEGGCMARVAGSPRMLNFQLHFILELDETHCPIPSTLGRWLQEWLRPKATDT